MGSPFSDGIREALTDEGTSAPLAGGFDEAQKSPAQKALIKTLNQLHHTLRKMGDIAKSAMSDAVSGKFRSGKPMMDEDFAALEKQVQTILKKLG